jgi:RNA polymerase sigma-70 factor (ECF subfamily)
VDWCYEFDDIEYLTSMSRDWMGCGNFTQKRTAWSYTQAEANWIHLFFCVRCPALCYFSVRHYKDHEHDGIQGCALSAAALSTDPAQLRAWLHAAAGHDGDAFRLLYEASSPRLYGLALRILGRRELAEEVLQESFVAIWNHAGDYEGALSAPMTWMTTIVRNRAFDVLRRNRAEAADDAEALDDHALETLGALSMAPADTVQMSGEARALADCMGALEEKHQQVLGMAFFHDLSHSDVAQKLTLPLGTVKTWIRRSLSRLQACLSARGVA